MCTTIGYFKFIDDEYINSFFDLEALWLSNVSTFFEEGKKIDDLINDRYEGALFNFRLPLPAFITSFTKVTTNSFDENDYLKNDIAEALIKSEEATEKKRDFVFIPESNMTLLKQGICNAMHGKRDGLFEKHDIFSREVEYLENYEEKMENFELQLLQGQVTKEQLGQALLATKSNSYKMQNEYRFGIVSSQVIIENIKLDKVPGMTVKLQPAIKFATAKFPRQKLQNLNRQELIFPNEN